jgi:hypothetical protein
VLRPSLRSYWEVFGRSVHINRFLSWRACNSAHKVNRRYSLENLFHMVRSKGCAEDIMAHNSVLDWPERYVIWHWGTTI